MHYFKKVTAIICVVFIMTVCIPVSGEGIDATLYKDTMYKIGNAVFKPTIGTIEIKSDKDSINFTDDSLGISGSISANIPNAEMLDFLRDNCNNKNAADKELINKFAEYRISLLDTMSEKIRIAHLYGNNEDVSDTVMKIFNEKGQKLYGLNARSAIFNVLKSDKTGTMEYTCIQLEVPDPGGNTDYSLSFKLDKGSLNNTTIQFINQIINEFYIRNIVTAGQSLAIFTDKNTVEQVNSGIYTCSVDKLSEFSNSGFGYSISLPDSVEPYRSNIISEKLDYRSWELDTNRSISVTSEFSPIYSRTNDNASEKVSDSADTWKNDSGNEKIGDKTFEFQYTMKKREGSTIYKKAYTTSNTGFIYTIALESKTRITDSDTELMKKILETFTYTNITRQSGLLNNKTESFINREEGYTFDYPSDWEVKEDQDSNVYYEAFSVKIPEISGTIDIDVSEGELGTAMTVREAAELLVSLGELTPGALKEYRTPYSGKTVRLLSSSIADKDGIAIVDRQLTYLDENGDGRMCYVRDIISGRRIVTLFITAADYSNIDGNIISPEFDSSLNSIIDSFRFASTPEYKARMNAGENRCRKLVFLQNFLEKTVGCGETVSVTGPGSSGEVLVEAGTGSDKGFYTIRLDSSASKAEIVSEITKSDIMKGNKDYLNGTVSMKSLYTYPASESVFMCNINGTVSYRSCFHILNTNLSAFVAMEYRPDTNENKILSWTSSDSLCHKAEQLYNASSYSVINCRLNNNDPFAVDVFLQSKKDGTVENDSKKVEFNPDTAVFEIE